MSIHLFRMARAASLAALLAAASLNPSPALAGDGCGGVVHGLSGVYNPATGAGFLAVRAGPTTRAAMIDELFNGDQVRIFERRGNWYSIAYSRGTGWAHARYVWNECGY